jgi:hypothetical protein
MQARLLIIVGPNLSASSPAGLLKHHLPGGPIAPSCPGRPVGPAVPLYPCGPVNPIGPVCPVILGVQLILVVQSMLVQVVQLVQLFHCALVVRLILGDLAVPLHSGGPLFTDSEAFCNVIWREAISDFNSAISTANSMHATVAPNRNLPQWQVLLMVFFGCTSCQSICCFR